MAWHLPSWGLFGQGQPTALACKTLSIFLRESHDPHRHHHPGNTLDHCFGDAGRYWGAGMSNHDLLMRRIDFYAAHTLDIYSETRPCKKCGGPASTHFSGYLIDRRCARCGYEWRERPLDHAESQASKQENPE